MPVPVEALRKVPFFSSVPDRDLARLADTMRERDVREGRDVVTQGEGGIAFFVVLEGEAAVMVDGESRRTLRAGDHFGEVALVLDNVPRTASVTATSDLRVASLTSWNFRPFVKDRPEIAWALLETLARRLVER